MKKKTEIRVLKIRVLQKLLIDHYEKESCALDVSFTGNSSYETDAVSYVIHETGKPWSRSLTREQVCEEMSKILFPDEDIRILGLWIKSGKVHLTVEKSYVLVFVYPSSLDLPLTCSRGYYSVDCNLRSGTINGGRSWGINPDEIAQQSYAFLNNLVNSYSDARGK